MLYRNQKIAANTIGIVAGLALLAWFLIGHAPSTEAIPRLGANVKVDAWVGGGIRPEPIRPEAFIKNPDLTAGAAPAQGNLTLHSENGTIQQIQLGLDDATGKEIAGQSYARSITIDFGENGSLGSSTLAELGKTPTSPFTMNPGQSKTIPVSVAIPLNAGDAVAGQDIHLTIVAEQAK